MNRIEGVSRRVQRNSPESNGHAYIAIPQGIDRDSFIETCYRRNRVTLITDFGAVINECYILNTALQEIEFPQSAGEKGSCVCYVSNSFSNKPIVIGVIYENDNSSLLNEQMFRFRKKMNETEILVQGDPLNNNFIISVTSGNPSNIKLSIKGNEESKLDIDSSGSVNVAADKTVNIMSFGELGFQIKDVEEQDAVYKTTINKEGIVFDRKNSEGEVNVTVDNATIIVNRKTEKITESVSMDDTGIHMTTKNDMTVDLTTEELNVKTGNSTLQMNNDLINFNGGGLEGLVKINDVTLKLNNLVNQINAFISIYNAHQHTVQVAVPAGTGNTLVLQGTGTSCDTFNKSDYENTKIKQG